MAKQPKNPKSAATKSRSGGTREPIFGSQVSNIIPGELIVQLREDVAGQITESVPTGPSRGHSAPGPSSFGITAVDSVLAELKTTSIVRLTPPVSLMTAGAARGMALASTFRVRYEGKTDVETAAQQVASADGVEYAEPNRYRETSVIPNDPSFPSQWGLTKINCPAAWDRTTGSPNVVVAVVDTGVDLDHPELAALLLPGTDMVDLGLNPTPPNGFHFEGDFTGRDNNPQDEVGHGTHVAGTVACASNNSVGVAGVTWACRLLPVRVLARIVKNTDPTDVRGVGSTADIAAGIRWAADNGARIINLSLGGTVDTQVERDAVAYAISQGVVVVAAMGNAFEKGNPTSFPAAYPDVVAVGAIDQSDLRAFFSQTGPHIDLSGPGVGVWSTVWDNGYAQMSGTSMAAPHVSGVAALILSCNPNLTAAQVADILRQTARPLRDNPSDPVPNDNYGFGCVDAEAALQRACPPRPSVPITTCPPSTLVRCPSRPVITCPTVFSCPPSRPVFTCPLPSRVVATCGPSRLVVCPSVTTICPSVSVATCPRPSLSISCPSGPVCGIDRPDLGPELSSFAAWGYDPYGYGGSGWETYDPYAYWYGDEDDKGGR